MKPASTFKSLLSITLIASLYGCSDDLVSSGVTDTISDIGITQKSVESTYTFNGAAVDGYITNAIVCLDLNDNGYCDLDAEPALTTDDTGHYSLDVSEYKEHPNFKTAHILVFDGYDSDTGEQFSGKLFAPQQASFSRDENGQSNMTVHVTAVTTLIAKMVDAGETLENAKSQLKKALNIPNNIDLTEDPIEMIDKKAPGASDFVAINIALNRSIKTLVAAASQDNSLANSNSSQLTDTIFRALAKSVKSQNISTELKSVEGLFQNLSKDPDAKLELKSNVLEKATTIAAITAKKTEDLYKSTTIANKADAQLAAMNATKIEKATTKLVKKDPNSSVQTINFNDENLDLKFVQSEVEKEVSRVEIITADKAVIEYLTFNGVSLTDQEATELQSSTQLLSLKPYTLSSLKKAISESENYTNSSALKSVVSKISTLITAQTTNPIPENPSLAAGRDIMTRATANTTKVQEHCPVNGGVQLDVGIDVNANGILDDAEIDPNRTQYICHGANGKDGANGLDGKDGNTFPVLTKTINLVAGENSCANGGNLIEVGQDLNEDSVLNKNEVQSTSSLCYPNTAPVFMDGLWGKNNFSKTANPYTEYNFTITATDEDTQIEFGFLKPGISLNFTVVNKPDWLTVTTTDATNISFSGRTPGTADTSQLKITISDGQDSTTGVWDIKILEPIDNDLDGIADEWETTTFGNLTTADATTDNDKDGILDIDEYKAGTVAALDSDGDGIGDALDAFPNNASYSQDLDTDGLPDEWENQYGGYWVLTPQGDSDLDSYTNMEEFKNGTDPTVTNFRTNVDYIEAIAGQDTVIDVLKNDTLGASGTTLTVSSVTQPTVGNLTVNTDNTLTFTSTATDGGPQKVIVSVSDGTLTQTSSLIINILDATSPTMVEFATGYSHTLMLMSDGKVYAWGNNNNGQLGDGSTTNKNTPTLGIITNVAKVFATGDHSFVILNDGTTWELGSTSTQLMMADGVTPLMDVQKITGGVLPIALDTSGNVYSLSTIGGGSATTTTTTTTTTLSYTTNVSVVTEADGITALSGIIDIASGQNHSLALRSSGEVIAWGSNNNGQLGNGSNLYSSTPVVVSNLSKITRIYATVNNSYAVDNLGYVYAWGDGYGIGDGNYMISRNVPVRVPNVANVTSLSAGLDSTYASIFAQTNSKNYIWGQSSNDHLLGYSHIFYKPTQVQTYNPTVISVSNGFSVFTENNTLYAIGSNHHGQLGNGSTIATSTPVEVLMSNDSVISGAQGENFEWGIIPPRWASSHWGTTQDPAVVLEGLTSVEVTDALTDGQSATLEANIFTAAGDMTYQYKVSSEQDFDTLTFSVDDVVQATYSGEVAWTLSKPVTLTAGQHKLTWTYSKDGGTSSGQDKAWIDDIQFPLDSDKDGASDLLDAAPYDATVQ